MTKDVTVDTWVAVLNGGHYCRACIDKGFIKENESIVIKYKHFIRFINGEGVTMPSFISPYYEVCRQVAKDLNASM